MSLISVSVALVALLGGSIAHSADVSVSKSAVLASVTIKEGISVAKLNTPNNAKPAQTAPIVVSRLIYSVRQVERQCNTGEVVSPLMCVVTTIELP